MWQISYPPGNGASLDSYLLFTSHNTIAYIALQYLASPEIIGVKVCHKRTDRQTNSLTPYTGVCGFFLSVKIATSLLTQLAGELTKKTTS